MQNEINQTWHFNQPPQTVWQYLTTPELLGQWLGPTDFKPVVRHKFRFFSPYGNDCICEVLQVTPFTKLCYSWQKNSAKDGLPFDSVIEWVLTPTETGTQLQLVHAGFKELEDVAPHQTGWNAAILQLEALLTSAKA